MVSSPNAARSSSIAYTSLATRHRRCTRLHAFSISFFVAYCGPVAFIHGVVQNAFCECAGAALIVWLGPVVLARELLRLRRGEADCLNLAIG
jgi:hypothetical protein